MLRFFQERSYLCLRLWSFLTVDCSYSTFICLKGFYKSFGDDEVSEEALCWIHLINWFSLGRQDPSGWMKGCFYLRRYFCVPSSVMKKGRLTILSLNRAGLLQAASGTSRGAAVFKGSPASDGVCCRLLHGSAAGVGCSTDTFSLPPSHWAPFYAGFGKTNLELNSTDSAGCFGDAAELVFVCLNNVCITYCG